MEGSWDFYCKALHTLKNLEHLENDGGQPGQALVNHTCIHLFSQACILQTRKQARSGSVLLQGCAAHSRHPGSRPASPKPQHRGNPASLHQYLQTDVSWHPTILQVILAQAILAPSQSFRNPP